MDKLVEVLELLEKDGPLPPRLKDHALTGALGRYRELHVAPDWLLIYEITNDSLEFVRTGSHADLFG